MAMEVFTSSSSGSRSIGSVSTSEPIPSFSQSTSARFGLEAIQSLIGGRYLRDRGTGMSDLVITSRPLLLDLLSVVQPYVIFKREHVRRATTTSSRLERVKDPEYFLQLAREVLTLLQP